MDTLTKRERILLALMVWVMLFGVMAFIPSSPRPTCSSINTIQRSDTTIFEVGCPGSTKLDVRGDTIFISQQ